MQATQPVESIALKSLSDQQVIQATKEVMHLTGVNERDISPIDTRDEALHVLLAIALVAKANPVINVVEALGEVPSAEEVAA